MGIRIKLRFKMVTANSVAICSVPCGALKPGLFSSPVHVLAVQCQVLVLVQFSYSCHFSVVRAWFEQSHLSLSSLV